MEKEHRALAQAAREIPIRWYESSEKRLACYVVLFIAITLLGVAKFGDPVAHLTAAITYITTTIADEKTTSKGFEAKDKAREAGFNFISGSVTELNPLLSHIETAQGYKAEKRRKLIMDGLGLTFSTILPSAGISMSGIRFLAAVSRRITNRKDRAIEIALNESRTN